MEEDGQKGSGRHALPSARGDDTSSGGTDNVSTGDSLPDMLATSPSAWRSYE